MPAAWPALRPLVDALLVPDAPRLDCWGLVQHLYHAGFGLNLHDPQTLAEQVVEVWWSQGDARPPLPLVQPWDCLIMSMKGLVSDHVGIVEDDATFVHAGQKAGVARSRLHRYESNLMQIARLRCCW